MNNNNSNVSIQITQEIEKDQDSIGDADDLKEKEEEQLNENKLGFDLPTNDLSKSGCLDDQSVDSYFIGDDELKDIDLEKKLDPINPNYKLVYDKIQQKYENNSKNK